AVVDLDRSAFGLLALGLLALGLLGLRFAFLLGVGLVSLAALLRFHRLLLRFGFGFTTRRLVPIVVIIVIVVLGTLGLLTEAGLLGSIVLVVLLVFIVLVVIVLLGLAALLRLGLRLALLAATLLGLVFL